MNAAQSKASKPRGYGRIVIEFLVTLIVLSVIGAILPSYISGYYEEFSNIILLGLGVAIMITLIRIPLKRRLEIRGGPHFAITVSYFASLIVAVAGFLALLSVLHISFSALLLAVGGISIVVGFAVSTITTNIISGAFMLTSYPIKVGQRIIITVNNQPGTITAVGALFMTVTTDAGAKLVIPNSAVFQGMAFLLDIDTNHNHGSAHVDESPQLLAKPGDRVISSIYAYPATVTEVTKIVTKLITDTGQLLVIPNQAILNGNTTLVRIQQQDISGMNLPIALGDDVRLSSGFTGKITEIGPYYFRVSGSDEDVLLPTVSLTNGGVIVFKKKVKSATQSTQN
jgi:small-conductance mechanosensitive channel